jgi:nucleotide-binding universal stress UspA family protein
MKLPVELFFVEEPGKSATASAVAAREYLARIGTTITGASGVEVTIEIGDAAGAIVTRGAAQRDTLIAMATHGYSGARRWLMGSVAEKVLHSAANHLLLVRPGETEESGEARLKTIVVPLDGSGVAERVLPVVSRLALALPLEILLLRVVPQLYLALPDTMLPVVGMNVPNQKLIWEQAHGAAVEYLNGRVEHLRADGVAAVSSLVLDGSAGGTAAEIIDLAKRTPANLVAMSTHGASGVGRWLLGSVTERVVRYSNDPVLIVRAQS